MSRKIRINKNLSRESLEKISNGLRKFAKSKSKPYKPENNAEKELLRKIDGLFTQMLDSLQEDITDIILE